MRQILLTFLFLIIFLIPKLEASAQATEACKAGTTPVCPAGSITRGQICANTQTGELVNPSSCSDGSGPEAGAAADTLPCTDKATCTSAKPVTCPDGLPGIMTAIGCVPTEPKALVEGILKFGILASGGVAFLLMILGALQMITAEGVPESIKHGQERFYSAIIGLLLIIFSVLLMQVLGVDILGLPKLGGTTTAPPTRNPDS
jgi:hypothetical protein